MTTVWAETGRASRRVQFTPEPCCAEPAQNTGRPTTCRTRTFVNAFRPSEGGDGWMLAE